MRILWLTLALALAAFGLQSVHAEQAESWRKDLGKPAPRLMAAGWKGTSVSLDEVKGNAVVLAFWNADIAC